MFDKLGLIFEIYYILSISSISIQQNDETLLTEQLNHRPKIISENQFWRISNELSDIENFHIALNKILIPRVPGTENHTIVKDFIINQMKNIGWTIETDKFLDETPKFGTLEFENIIATQNPNAKRYLTLACHYDSKSIENIDFVGATDSAVPCAIMINIAITLDKYLKSMDDLDLSLQFIFFDGEEAFVEWTPTDSIYGARHLAEKWEKEDKLKNIDILMLLDLLGAAGPNFYSYFTETDNWYNHLLETETRLGAAGSLVQYAHNSAVSKTSSQGYFQPYSVKMQIEDDHIPFLIRKVRVLHLIPSPFPGVWHTANDDLHAIDFAVVTNLNKIIGMFCLEYLNVDVEHWVK